MIRKILESHGVSLSNTEYEEVLLATTEDIKFNKIGFKKRTTYKEFLSITLRTATVIKRCE